MDVWVAPLDVPPALQDRLVAALSPRERDRADRYRFPDDARRFSVAKGWLRLVLGHELGVPAPDVAFADGPGKPALLGGPFFNVSHAGDLTVIAVADHQVGVDVEHRRSGGAALDAARVACTPVETAALDRMPVGERADAFLRLWTAKEAFLKGLGTGLAVAPDSIELGTDASVGVAGAPRWWVRELRAGPDYVGAVAANRSDFTLRLRPLPRPVPSASI